jgi:hypothetical protein
VVSGCPGVVEDTSGGVEDHGHRTPVTGHLRRCVRVSGCRGGVSGCPGVRVCCIRNTVYYVD